jgi:hypothetical protein
MKIKFTTFAAVVAFVICITVSAQQAFSQDITHLRLHRMGDNASVNWGTTNPGLVSYFLIERSYDGEIFETVAEVTPTTASNYRYRDVTVLPGMISYRITSFNADGSSSQSPVEILRLTRRR